MRSASGTALALAEDSLRAAAPNKVSPGSEVELFRLVATALPYRFALPKRRGSVVQPPCWATLTRR
jgi:hypothetical protein